MRCPFCQARDSRVVDSRELGSGDSIRRRRECSACGRRFTTYERVETGGLIVVKRDGRREEFDREKLAAGLQKALTRRPVPERAAGMAAESIEAELRAGGIAEVSSQRIGTMAMDRLRALDQIAYIRFASVYQSFEDIEQLKREVDGLLSARAASGPGGKGG